MKAALRTAIAEEMLRARAAETAGHYQQAVAYLERAHILGQRYFLTHLHTHFCMLRIARRRQDALEIRGQVLRLIAVTPGYVFGWVPKGNTGGADVSALKPMPIPSDLAPFLKDHSVWRDVGVRFTLAILAASAYIVCHALLDRARSASIEISRPPAHELIRTGV